MTKPSTYYNEPIDTSNPLHGQSRSSHATPEVQERIIDIIIEEAHKLNFSNRDTAYYIAIAQHESKFNPDAANKTTTAAGVAQMLSDTGATYGLNDKNRFDARSNISAGLRYFADLKAQVLNDFKRTDGDYEPLIYYSYHFGQYSTRRKDKDPKKNRKTPYNIEDFKSGELKGHYDDSAKLLDVVNEIEFSLNDHHALSIKLTDIEACPMSYRKGVCVVPIKSGAVGKSTPNTPAVPPVKSHAVPPAPAAPQPAAIPASAQRNVQAGPAGQSGEAQSDGVTGVAAPDPAPRVSSAQAEQNPSATANASGATTTTVGDTQTALKDASTQCAAGTTSTTGDGQTELKDNANQCAAPATATDGDDETEAKGQQAQCLAKGWTWKAIEMTTDADGKFPEIVTDSHQPIYILIPRPEYLAYNDAVAKQSICEVGNQHDILPKDNQPTATGVAGEVTGKTDTTTGDQTEGTQGDQSSGKKADNSAQSAGDANLKDPMQPTEQATPAAALQGASATAQTAPPISKLPAPAAVQQVPKQALPAPVQQTHAVTAKPNTPAQRVTAGQGAPVKAPSLTALEVLEVVNKTLSWQNLLLTTFSYIKEFHTRPKLPEKPLDPKAVSDAKQVRTVTINSSLKTKEVKTPEAKATVPTAKKTAEQKVEATGDAPWMTKALEEEAKQIQTQKTPSPKKDPAWQAARAKREEAKKAKAQATADLKKEASRKKPPPDPAKISALQAEIAQQEKNSGAADAEMEDIENKCYTTDGYNNDQVVKYLGSVFGENSDMARDISTYWCASFVNWCLKKGGYKGTNNGRADSYLNWGEKIDVPKPGAIVVVTRSSKPDYHVGFFLGIYNKTVVIGQEEVDSTDKHGKSVKKKINKTKEVEYVKLLSGNYSHSVKDGVEWAVNSEDNETCHLISYRWPTEADKLPSPM